MSAVRDMTDEEFVLVLDATLIEHKRACPIVHNEDSHCPTILAQFRELLAERWNLVTPIP